jgi:hypothetical protein
MARGDGGAAAAGPARPLARRNLPRVLIVAEHASARFGGEAVLALHYFRVLRRRGVEAWLLVHERTRDELERVFPDERARIRYGRRHAAPTCAVEAGPDAAGPSVRLHHRLCDARAHAARPAAPGARAGGRAGYRRGAPADAGVAQGASLLRRVGAPVVIGPMNGGMSFPPAFTGRQGGSRAG